MPRVLLARPQAANFRFAPEPAATPPTGGTFQGEGGAAAAAKERSSSEEEGRERGAGTGSESRRLGASVVLARGLEEGMLGFIFS